MPKQGGRGSNHTFFFSTVLLFCLFPPRGRALNPKCCCGDFRQLLPVIPKGRGDLHIIQRCSWWSLATMLNLRHKFRSHQDASDGVQEGSSSSSSSSSAAATAVAVAVAAAHHHDRIYWRRPCAPTPILFLQRYTYAGPGNDDDDDEAHETALLTKN